jgi:hypothetical protein
MQPLRNVSEWFKELSMKDSGVLYEDPFVQVCLSRTLLFYWVHLIRVHDHCFIYVNNLPLVMHIEGL